jgi:uncharacterized 2Fe-2S/4Fe-4S cluster protein (DUF4445 family)
MSNGQMMKHFIHFEPVGRRGELPAGGTLLDHARTLGIDLISLCGGSAGCGRCIVQVLEGEVSEPTSAELEFLLPEQIDQGYRLACCTIPHSDCLIRVPPESLTSPQRMQVEGEELPIDPNPLTQAYPILMTPPTLDDIKSDTTRLTDVLEQQHNLKNLSVDIDVLRQISPLLRESVDPSDEKWHVQVVVREREIIGLLPLDLPQLGLAVDLGTTKIAVYLLNLHTGQTLASRALMNPQITYGEDVIARIAYTVRDESNASLLRELVVEALNETITQMCAEVDAKPSNIADSVIVGNTAMHHIFLGLPVKQLVKAPFVPAVTSALDLKARDLGLAAMPGSYVHMLANIAGYVGADHVAMLLATEIEQQQVDTLAIDIGTNTEICLLHKGTMTSTSCASGPAFEGAHIKHGMRAAGGAIEHLRLLEDRLEFQTIGGTPPVGLCGSGILDAMAQLYLAGILDKQGRMRDHPRVRRVDGEREFMLVDPSDNSAATDGEEDTRRITISQKDIRQLQLAKGAIHTGIELLFRTNGLSLDDIDQVIVAGAFGTYIDITSAITIGMLPDLPLERFRQVGNAAGVGAKLALVSRTKRAEARALGEKIEYLELATHPLFRTTFAQSMFIGQHR